MSHPIVTITNQTNDTVQICKFELPAGASADNTDTLYPVLTPIDTVAPNSVKQYTPSESTEYLTFTRQSDMMPYSAITTKIISPSSVTITPDDLTKTAAAFDFYKSYKGSPYSPDSLAVTDIILNNAVLQQKTLLNNLFTSNKYSFDYTHYSVVSYWAENYINAWSGGGTQTEYVYQVDPPQPFIPLVLPKEIQNRILIPASRAGVSCTAYR